MASECGSTKGGRKELENELKKLDIETLTIEHPEVNFRLFFHVFNSSFSDSDSEKGIKSM